MNKIINLLNSEYSKALNKKKHPILGSPTFNIGFIEGGYRANVVPDFCRISIDRRLIPGENYRSVVKEIKKIIKKSRINDIEVKALNWIKCNPMEISANELIVKSVSKNLKAITNMKPKIAGIPYWCDASSFVNIMKTPTLIFGPGELEQAHSSSEFISIKKLKIFAKTIFLTILDICNKEKPQV
jgi:acetylornithine deacetylase/succinyl-diaminopimelate desuccinylase-like protein